MDGGTALSMAGHAMTGYTSTLDVSLLLPEVEALLVERLNEHACQSTYPQSRILWNLLSQTIVGGKKVRPYLTLLVATCGGTVSAPEHLERVYAAAAALELLHAGLIIQDDVMDGDSLRRGAPTVPALLEEHSKGRGLSDPRRFAASAATIVGDLALTGGYRLLIDCGNHTRRLIDIFDRAIRETAEGQYLDVLNMERSEEADVLVLERLKTGVYSFEAPVEIGAVLADLPKKTRHDLTEGARDVGIAFQIVDDILGVFGDPASTGKSASSDLHSRKRTVLTLHAHRQEDPRWQEVWAELGQVEEEQGRRAVEEQARHLLVDLGSLEYAQQMSARFHQSAREHFASDMVPGSLSAQLVEFTDSLEKRSA